MNNENICTVNDINKPSDRGRKREIYPVDSIASLGYVQWKVEAVEVTICIQRERQRGSLFPTSALAIYYARQSVISVLVHLHLPQSSSSSSV